MSLSATDAGTLMRRATYASVAVACTLIVLKLGAWVATGSVALLSTLIDSLLDAGASLINLIAVRHALAPADREHRFGHGKAEPLAGLGQAAFVAGSAVFLTIESVRRLLDPSPVAREEWGIAVMLISILLTIGLVRYQAHVVKQTKSVAINADQLHYTGDVLINGSVIISLLLARFLGWSWADPLFALGIAAYLVSNAWAILSTSMNLLMDHELPEDDRARIKDICRSHPEVIDMHDLRTRSAGPVAFIQLHLEMDGKLPLVRAHAIGDQVEAQILEAFPNAEIIIHQDPSGVREDRQTFG